jgi:hypothetical protein
MTVMAQPAARQKGQAMADPRDVMRRFFATLSTGGFGAFEVSRGASPDEDRLPDAARP